jgi:hypothetical protein
MADQDMPTYYVRRGEPLDVATFVTVHEQVDGNVHFYNAWGGPGYYVSEELFANDFDVVPAEELDRIFRTYKSIRVTWDDGANFMTGYTNGHLWNGFECPSFTKDEILAQLQPGGHLAPGEDMRSNRFVWSDLADTFVLIEGVDGTDVPEAIAVAPFEALLAEGRLDEADELAQKMGLEVSLAEKFTVVPEGEDRPVQLFVIDNGWCWGNMDKYDLGDDNEDDLEEATSLAL